MIPAEYRSLGDTLLDHCRVISLSSKYEYGKDIDEEHLLDKLDKYLETFKYGTIVHKMDRYRSEMEFPYLGEVEYRKDIMPVDTLLHDRHRQYHAICERFEKGVIPDHDFRQMSDPSTKIHMSFARGNERKLIKHFNMLDSEARLRKSLISVT